MHGPSASGSLCPPCYLAKDHLKPNVQEEIRCAEVRSLIEPRTLSSERQHSQSQEVRCPPNGPGVDYISMKLTLYVCVGGGGGVAAGK